MASTAEKLDPELWEQAKADAREKFGGHSARAMQYAVKLYKERGGRYRGKKKQDNRLTQWAAQDWTTKSGRPSKETGERYLPRGAIAALTSAEYGATTRAKRAGGGVGQSVAQPKSIREKTRKFRKVNPMPTPAQIAARKKFAERARSGELAKMRKKNPVKKPTRAASRKANPITETLIYVTGFDPTVMPDFVVNVLNRPKRKRNPTATRAPARKRTKLMSNGERKKNPRQRMGKIAFLSAGGEMQIQEVPIDFSFKQYVGNIQEDFFARTENGFLIVTEKSTGFKVGQVPHTMRAAYVNDRAAAKRFVESVLERVGADAFRKAIMSKPKIA